jgi:hypothetical protein
MMNFDKNIDLIPVSWFNYNVRRHLSATKQHNVNGLLVLKVIKINCTPVHCNQTVMGIPSVTSAVFLISKSFWEKSDKNKE